MSENTTAEIVVGGVVLAAAVGFFIYAAQATGFERDTGSYELVASFRSVEGIGLGTDVRLAGVRVGSVTGLELNPTTYRADTTISIRDEIEIPDDSAIAVASEGLLGGSFVEILPGGSPFALEPGGEIIDTQSSVSLITLLLRFVTGDGEGE
ncbi:MULTISPECIES: outer membrane lipid asymmetry maintenance protein MlaD [Paracoccaceae]|jgi:phospholipid/cholesterol/gamma-HCH transport system substrate-binding protein|uniref:Outer membrane lipid asymmetry maintenance protein MlaD n=1 Tax=Rhodophyticola porphyridii TaxID=1852017 RepID=A0A3L9Y6R5_9RHOB|nr:MULTISPECIES: outer membrane lipid asymmetry maintenance protein MlaD [Paracoccaceae]MBO6626499.1 outer membrane lipid asymmetry maintenance protein MlaD [Roseicyclus sp.]MBO6923585.1 outer membrane lipid asymmetry maintenance protein MlaD [Roseicyclus sp.]RMA43155.1 outer membrane lipid asymmetry maintenance protein MlaD [Rhodophyticola porphyridii]